MKVLSFALIGAVALFGAGDFSNRRAPGFSLADSHFQQHDTQDYRGRILLIDVMATTCPTCGRLADVLVEIKEKYGDKVDVISVLTVPDNYQTGDRFAAEHKITWPLVYDSGQVLASYMKATPNNATIHFPHLFVIDEIGWIRDDFEVAGDKALTVGDLSARIDSLIKSRSKPDAAR